MRYITQESVEVAEVVNPDYNSSFGNMGVIHSWVARVDGHSWDETRLAQRVRSARVSIEREGSSFEDALSNLKAALAEQKIELR